MRLIAILSLLMVLALAVFISTRIGHQRRPPANTPQPSDIHQTPQPPSRGEGLAVEQTNTNAPAGFYLGKGDQRVYVDYATPNPALRSFMQSVMEGNTDPNAQGREIFMRICAACHQRDGDGKDGLAPALAGSEWVLAPGGGRLARIVLNGLTGPIHVRGKDWNLVMPPLRENLNDQQVAVVLSYVRSQVGTNHAPPITPDLVAAARKETRAKPETSAALLQISDR